MAAENSVIETYLSDELPPIELCTAVHSLVFKDGMLLMSDLREGERPVRQLDIPGGHIDLGETPENSLIRETMEETGVRVSILKLAAYKVVTLHNAKPEGYKYPYPTSYILFYLCGVLEEIPFEGSVDTHGRVWIEYEKSTWYINNKDMVDEILAEYKP